MATLLLIVIYLAFISLGLPDSILGSAWPTMHQDLNVSVSSAGIVTMVVSGCTIISTLISEKVIKRFGTHAVSFVSVLLTAGALLGFSFSNQYYLLLVLAVPLGLGAGSIDAALNNYVAVHFKATHMNWLHCCWGLGAMLGPIIISSYILKPYGWQTGYRTISFIQFGLALILLISVPLWKKNQYQEASDISEESVQQEEAKSIWKLKGVKVTMLVLFFYCAAELSTGLWGSSFLVQYRGFTEDKAAAAISLYYAGITIGRMLAGFLSIKLNNKNLIRIGVCVSVVGAALLLFPTVAYISMAGLLLIGVGFAPIYPAMLHETPRRFGIADSQKIIGYQMSCAYVGITFMPMLLGQVSRWTSLVIYPGVIIGFILLCGLCAELAGKAVAKNEKNDALHRTPETKKE